MTYSKKKARPGLKNVDVRKLFFSKKVIDNWHNLTEYEVSARSTSTFKERYDKMEKLRQLDRIHDIYDPR